MELVKVAMKLFTYGEIVQDNNVLTVDGWQRVTVIKYEKELFWIKMLKGDVLEIEKIF